MALCFLLASCSTTPSTMTVHGTVTLTSVNGVPPAQAYSGYGGPDGIQSEVNIVADDGPGNYQGQPWNEAVTNMALQSSTAKEITFTFTAQVPDDAVMYQIQPICCDDTTSGQSFTLQEMQQGVSLCYGDACPPG